MTETTYGRTAVRHTIERAYREDDVVIVLSERHVRWGRVALVVAVLVVLATAWAVGYWM